MSAPALGLRANARQFALLVGVNALVGAVLGLERVMLPLELEGMLGVDGKLGLLSFVAAFGLGKATGNYAAGQLADRVGRKPMLIGGWVLALPVPWLLLHVSTLSEVLLANLLLGLSQGLAWSSTVIMKIDLVGPKRRGWAMGINECAGYVAVALSALGSSALAARGLSPFAPGLVFVAVGLALSAGLVKETRAHAEGEAAGGGAHPGAREVFWRTTWRDPQLAPVTRAGLVNNLNDGVAWGLFPGLFASAGLDAAAVAGLVALVPLVWGLGQLGSGPLSDRVGRRLPIAAGMAVQALGLGVVAVGRGFGSFALGQVLLGLGTALVYPTLLAAIGDGAHPRWRASAVGVYRLWRDLGYVFGALLAGLAADALGVRAAVGLVALLTLASGLEVWGRLKRPTDGRLLRAAPN